MNGYCVMDTKTDMTPVKRDTLKELMVTTNNCIIEARSHAGCIYEMLNGKNENVRKEDVPFASNALDAERQNAALAGDLAALLHEIALMLGA